MAAATELDDGSDRTAAPSERRSGSGRVAVGLLLALFALVATVALTRPTGTAAIGDLVLDPASLAGDGALAVGSVPPGDVHHLERGSHVRPPSGEVVVVRLAGGEVVVLSHVVARGGVFATPVGEIGGRPLVAHEVVPFTHASPESLVPCRSEVAAVRVDAHRAVQVAGPVARPVLHDLLARTSLAGERLVVGLPDGASEVGRLPAGWNASPDGSRSERVDHATIEVVPLDASGVAALTALRCPDPVQETPPGSGAIVLDPTTQPPRTLSLDGGRVEVGLLDEYTQLAVFGGERGAAIFVRPFEDWLGDRALAELAAGVERVDLDALLAAHHRSRIEETTAAVTGLGYDVLATGSTAGEPWLAVAGPYSLDPSFEVLCLVHAGGTPDEATVWSSPCTHDTDDGDLAISAHHHLVLAEVSSSVERVAGRFPGGETASAGVIATGDDRFPHVAVLGPVAPLSVSGGGGSPDGFRFVSLADGEVGVDAIGPDGEVLATRRIAADGTCPLPPGCAVAP